MQYSAQPGPEPMSRPVPPIEPTYKRCNHTLHLLLTVLTLTMWGFMVWPWVAIYVNVSNAAARRRYEEATKQYSHQLGQWEQAQRR